MRLMDVQLVQRLQTMASSNGGNGFVPRPKRVSSPHSRPDLRGQAVLAVDLLMASLRLGVVLMSGISPQGETLPMLMIVRFRLALASMNHGREERRSQARLRGTVLRPLSGRSLAVSTPRGF
jgi:hypothetical protein